MARHSNWNKFISRKGNEWKMMFSFHTKLPTFGTLNLIKKLSFFTFSPPFRAPRSHLWQYNKFLAESESKWNYQIREVRIVPSSGTMTRFGFYVCWSCFRLLFFSRYPNNSKHQHRLAWGKPRVEWRANEDLYIFWRRFSSSSPPAPPLCAERLKNFEAL